MPESDLSAYASRLTPAVFDFMVRWIYWPTAISDVRARIVELLELDEKTTVLEPGAGTGGFTRHWVDAGASVTCVDRAPVMLERLRTRVPEATVAVSAAAEFRSEERFDRALLALFLHEQTSADRVRILRMAHAHLKPGGLMAVADTSAPSGPIARTLRRAFLRTFEPATVLEVADGALEAEIQEAASPFATTSRSQTVASASGLQRPEAPGSRSKPPGGPSIASRSTTLKGHRRTTPPCRRTRTLPIPSLGLVHWAP